MLRIVTDTNASLPLEKAAELKVEVVPITVEIEGKVYRDLYDLPPDAYIERLKTMEKLPRTSQPSVGAFETVYWRLLEEGADAVISIHLSGALSGTYQSAVMAAQTFPEGKVFPFDTRSASSAVGLMVIEAVKMAEEGASVEEIMTLLDHHRAHSHVVFLVDTLEYLHKGGRIGGAARLLGTMLKIKPILYLDDGRIEVLEQQRTARKAFRRLKELAVEIGKSYRRVDVAVMEIGAAEKAAELADFLKSHLEIRRFLLTKIGPGLSTHTGPGALGFAIIGLD